MKILKNLEEKRKKWLDKLKSDTGNVLTAKQLELDAVIRQRIKERGFVNKIEGVFGDTFHNFGFVEEYLKTEKGIQIKFFGCSYLFKGDLKRETIDSTAVTKRIVMETIKFVLKHKIVVGLNLLFRWRKIIKEVIYWFAHIYEADLKKKTYRFLPEFSPLPRELIRAGLVLVKKLVPLTPGKNYRPEYQWGEEVKDDSEYQNNGVRCVWAFGTFIQNDTAYYWRIQDPLSNLNKESLLKNPRKEIKRIFDLAIEREHFIKDKIRIFRDIVLFAFLFPAFKKPIKEYFLELDIEKIKPDKEDWYWSARKQSYDFGGIAYQERMKEAERIDKEEGNVIFGLENS